MSPLRLELEWEEGIFRGLRALWRGLGDPKEPQGWQSQACASAQRQRLLA